jgi:hypothetical protein
MNVLVCQQMGMFLGSLLLSNYYFITVFYHQYRLLPYVFEFLNHSNKNWVKIILG